MTPAEEIFLALADLDAAAREMAISERCADDPALRAEVYELLAALDVPEPDFLDPAAIPSLDMAAVDGPLQPGMSVGGFLVLRALGSGGMGVVYAAQQDRPRRTVALKVLRRGFRHPEILKRFAREAEVLGRLQHPGIAQVYAFHLGDRGTPAHLVMELITGPPVTEYVRAHALAPADRISLMIAICDAVQHAHDRGVVHRDLKPANVLVSHDGQPKVLDFGIARAAGVSAAGSSLQTSFGQMLGTITYMSPEQLRGASDQVDHRSDVYALGVMLYRIMAGRLPFDVSGLSLVEAAQRIINTRPAPLEDLDPAFAGPVMQVAQRAMAIDRERRYQSAADMKSDLRACRDGGEILPSPRHWKTDADVDVLIAESADRSCVALGLRSGTVVILDASTGRTLATRPGDSTPVEHLHFNADGSVTIGQATGTHRLSFRR